MGKVSKKFIKIINRAVEADDVNLIIDEIKKYKPHTRIAMSYPIMHYIDKNFKEPLVGDETHQHKFSKAIKDELLNTKILAKFKKDRTEIEKYKITDTIIFYEDIKFIVDIGKEVLSWLKSLKDTNNIKLLTKRDIGFKSKYVLLYQLLNTGRRLVELTDKPYEIKRGEDEGFYIEVAKQYSSPGSEPKMCKIMLLDGDLDSVELSMHFIRGGFDNEFLKKEDVCFKNKMPNIKIDSISSGMSAFIKTHLKNTQLLKSDFTPHNLRGVYAKLIYTFYQNDIYNTEEVKDENIIGERNDNRANITIGNVIKECLHHSGDNTRFYNNIIFRGFVNNPFRPDVNILKESELKVMTVTKLKSIAKSLNRKGYSKMKKNDIIKLILTN